MRYAALTIPISLLCFWGFLLYLKYPTHVWYYLVLMTVLAAGIDLSIAQMVSLPRIRVFRLGLVAAMLIGLAWPAGRGLSRRQTNVDLLAEIVARDARKGDLIVVSPWTYGLTFLRYYRGEAEWETLPQIEDLRTSRFDQSKARMMQEDPLRDLLDRSEETLRAGGKIWLVGEVHFKPDPDFPEYLPPAPNPWTGWNEKPYLYAWSQQYGTFLREHVLLPVELPLPEARGEPGDLEFSPLFTFQGWHDNGHYGAAIGAPR